MTDLAKHQPLYYKKSKIMQAIDGALDTEFDRLKAAAADISLESNIQTTNDWISVWESSVGLSHNTELTLEQRRSRVLARYRQVGSTTKARVVAIVESYSRGNVEIVENSAEYTITIKFIDTVGKPDNMDGVIEQLKRIIPAHIAVNFEYKYRTWREVLASGKTWRELKDAGYTWNDILNKEDL